MDYIINAKKKPLGRLATEAALILQGKKSVNYSPEKIGEDRAMIHNYKDVVVTGNKAKQRVYYRHTGYVGHLKEERYEERFEKDPKKAIREAVRHMLPKNFLTQRRIKNLIFVENE